MPLNEQIVTGRSFRKCIDVTNKLWQKISFWSKASDVEFDDGENAETKLGAIKGITTDLNITETGYAADMTALAQLNSEITDTKWIKIIVNAPFVYTVTSNTTTTANIKYTVPDGYNAVGLVGVTSQHNSVLVCGFNQSTVVLHSIYAYGITNYTGYATVLCVKK